MGRPPAEQGRSGHRVRRARASPLQATPAAPGRAQSDGGCDTSRTPRPRSLRQQGQRDPGRGRIRVALGDVDHRLATGVLERPRSAGDRQRERPVGGGLDSTQLDVAAVQLQRGVKLGAVGSGGNEGDETGPDAGGPGPPVRGLGQDQHVAGVKAVRAAGVVDEGAGAAADGDDHRLRRGEPWARRLGDTSDQHR